MFKKIPAIRFIVLILIITPLLSACRESSRGFIEGKAAKLEKAYPSKDLFELFDKFPDGFHFRVATYFDRTSNASTAQEIILEGDGKTREIKGTIVQDRTEVDKNRNRKVTVHFESDVTYTKDGFVFSNPEVTEKNLRYKDFLIQKFSINKEILSKLKMTDKSYSWETGAADITYALQDKTVNRFLSLNENEEIKMRIVMNEYTVHKNRFGYGLTFTGGGVDYVESIKEK